MFRLFPAADARAVYAQNAPGNSDEASDRAEIGPADGDQCASGVSTGVRLDRGRAGAPTFS